MKPSNTLVQLALFSYWKKKKRYRNRLKSIVCPSIWCLCFSSYKVRMWGAWKDAEFWAHSMPLGHWDVCWQPKRVEAPLQFYLGAFKVYFMFVLYSRFTAVIFLLFFWCYYWPGVHFLMQAGWGLLVAIPFPHPHFMPEEGPHSQCVPPEWKRGNTHPTTPGKHSLWPQKDCAVQGPWRWALEV